MAWTALAVVAWVPSLAAGQTYLPPDAQVSAALQAQPAVRAAAARVDVATATRSALAAGSHEVEASVWTQQRHVAVEGRTYNEWEVQISRPIRLPGKAQLDRKIGDSTRGVADLRLDDAEHQVARRLLELWMDWLRSELAAEETAAQETLLGREKEALARRVALGDAAQRDMDVLEAERALLAAQTVSTRSLALAARHALTVEFPQITVPARPPELPDPQPLPGGLQAWRERIVDQSVEISIANGESARLSLVAARVRTDRTPDPSVGVRMMSDRGGAERVVGVVFSMPFGTDYRSALAAAESANAAAAEAEAIGVRRMVEQGAWAAVQDADSKREQWQSHRYALAAQNAATTRTRRAWELGEAPLSEHLLAQRNLRQARLTEAQARVDALQAAALVRIDAHALWHSDVAEPGAAGDRHDS
jgi:outer membrane protein TolC